MRDEDIYRELCNGYRAIDDFRMKLLGFLPLASGGIFAFFLSPDILEKDVKLAAVKALLPAMGTFGFLVTLGLFALEIFGIRKCTALIIVGAHLESAQGNKHGQFTDRPKALAGFISEPFAAGVIYSTVLAGWLYFALHFSNDSRASVCATVIFAVFLMLTIIYILWLKIVEIPKLKLSLLLG